MLERASRELAPFLDEIAFIGGATIVLWITDPAAPAPRPTKDVDVVVEVASRLAWYDFEERLRAHGLRHDSSSSVICRWRAGDGKDDLLVDLMPSDASILGFENRWQQPALDHAKTVSLPSGQEIRAIPPPYLIATKLEATGMGAARAIISAATISRTSSPWLTAERKSLTKSLPPPEISAHSFPKRSRLC